MTIFIMHTRKNTLKNVLIMTNGSRIFSEASRGEQIVIIMSHYQATMYGFKKCAHTDWFI